MSRIRVLLVSRTERFAADVAGSLRDARRYKIDTRIVTNGHVDPLHDVAARPDILLLDASVSTAELQFLADHQRNNAMPLIVIGGESQPDLMRLAIRAGASDYLLAASLEVEELISALDRAALQLIASPTQAGELIAVTNTSGGSGASFVATNLALGFHTMDEVRTLLVDFDIQFGSLARSLDLAPRQGLLEALESIEDMDEVSAETYISTHKSGLRLLPAVHEGLFLNNSLQVDRVDALFRLLLKHNEYVIADVPRRIDPCTAPIFETADHIVIVMQQSLSHVQNALTMTHLVTRELGISRSRITLVLNRFNKHSLIDQDIIKDTLKVDEIVTLPNQFDLVSESIDTGKPVMQEARSSAIARALNDLRVRVGGEAPQTMHGGLLARALPSLLRRTH